MDSFEILRAFSAFGVVCRIFLDDNLRVAPVTPISTPPLKRKKTRCLKFYGAPCVFMYTLFCYRCLISQRVFTAATVTTTTRTTAVMALIGRDEMRTSSFSHRSRRRQRKRLTTLPDNSEISSTTLWLDYLALCPLYDRC